MRAARLGAGVVLLFGFALASADVAGEVAVPPLTSRVTDLTGTLSGGAVARIEAKLKDFEAKKGSQVAVLIVPTTQPEEIEQYGIRVAEAWKLGRKGVDDGAILLIAKDDRHLRIEVGQGLEGALPDAIANRIVAETITPHFKQNDFDGGVEAGVNQIISVVNGEPLPAPDKKWERRGDDLYTVVPITVSEASLGAKVEVPTIDGRAQVRIPPGTNSGKKLRLREKGAPSARQAGKRGDQIVEVQIVVPKPEDERVRNLLKELDKIDHEDPRQDIFARATV